MFQKSFRSPRTEDSSERVRVLSRNVPSLIPEDFCEISFQERNESTFVGDCSRQCLNRNRNELKRSRTESSRGMVDRQHRIGGSNPAGRRPASLALPIPNAPDPSGTARSKRIPNNAIPYDLTSNGFRVENLIQTQWYRSRNVRAFAVRETPYQINNDAHRVIIFLQIITNKYPYLYRREFARKSVRCFILSAFNSTSAVNKLTFASRWCDMNVSWTSSSRELRANGRIPNIE